MALKWDANKIALLKSYLEQGLTVPQIAEKVGETLDSTQHAITRYGLRKEPSVIKATKVTAKKTELIDLDAMKESNFEELKKAAKLQWEIKETKVSANKDKGFKTYLVTSDHHVPHQNVPAVKAILKMMDDIKFDGFFILGDYLDCGCISHWNKTRHKTVEGQRLKQDFIAGNALLDEFDKRLPKGAEKYYLQGNHEKWLEDIIEEYPALDGLLDLDSALFLEKRGYKYTKYNGFVHLGRLNLTHGIYAGGNPVKKHIDECKTNILFGHTHTIAEQLSSSPAREIALSGYNVGCLCDLAPEYAKNRPNCWSHGFALVYVWPNGYFEVDNHRILEGRFIYGQKIYDGNV